MHADKNRTTPASAGQALVVVRLDTSLSAEIIKNQIAATADRISNINFSIAPAITAADLRFVHTPVQSPALVGVLRSAQAMPRSIASFPAEAPTRTLAPGNQ